MADRAAEALAPLHETDETAWLDQTAEMVRNGQFQQVDAAALAEFLTDMVRRDRREARSRLLVLLSHLLKWDFQPERRSGPWLATILGQQQELRQLLESATLRNHAALVLADAYIDARKQAAAETGLARSAFPEECPFDVDGALSDLRESILTLRVSA